MYENMKIYKYTCRKYKCEYIYIYTIYIYKYIHIHVFRPSQDSSVWLGLTSREQMMSPECSKKVYKFIKVYKRGNKDSRFHITLIVSTGASDRSFYPIFNKRFDHLETLLII